MRTLCLLTLLLLATTISHAQLKNTKWKGKLMVPDETDVILNFKSDSVDMIIADANVVGETMAYTVTDGVITMKKLGGNSPCNIGDVFKLKYSIKDDKLFLNNLSDPCDSRAQAWTKEPLIRVKE